MLQIIAFPLFHCVTNTLRIRFLSQINSIMGTALYTVTVGLISSTLYGPLTTTKEIPDWRKKEATPMDYPGCLQNKTKFFL